MKQNFIVFDDLEMVGLKSGRKTTFHRPVYIAITNVSEYTQEHAITVLDHTYIELRCFDPNSRLWVKETWQVDHPEYVATYKSEPWRGTPDPNNAGLHYKTEEENPDMFIWKSARTMPQWASRFEIEITNAEYLHFNDLSEVHIKTEGIGSPITRDCKLPLFRDNWNKRFKRYHSTKNPLVWRVGFKMVDNEV